VQKVSLRVWPVQLLAVENLRRSNGEAAYIQLDNAALAAATGGVLPFSFSEILPVRAQCAHWRLRP
jgi:hypothetical protein